MKLNLQCIYILIFSIYTLINSDFTKNELVEVYNISHARHIC